METEDYEVFKENLEAIQKVCAKKGVLSDIINETLDALKYLSKNEKRREEHKARFAQFRAMKKRFTELTKGLN